MSMDAKRQLILPALQSLDWAPHAAWNSIQPVMGLMRHFQPRRILLMGFVSGFEYVRSGPLQLSPLIGLIKPKYNVTTELQ
jgi:hypothetical protein